MNAGGYVRSARAQIKMMIAEDMDDRTIANKLQISLSVVKQVREQVDRQKQAKSGSWDETEIAVLQEMMQNGKTYQEIAEVLNRKTESVKARAQSVKGEGRKRKWTPERREKMMQMAEDGVPISDIARHFGVQKKTLQYALHTARRDAGISGTTNKYLDLEERPPLTDLPKHPGCQCGYCIYFKDAHRAGEFGIAGTCSVQGKMTARGDFCTADKRPPQNGKRYPILMGNKVVWVEC